MTVFSYHLVKCTYLKALTLILFPPKSSGMNGLIFLECMTFMKLGSEVFSFSRLLNNRIAVFAQWENEEALNQYLSKDDFGKILAKGWFTKLQYLRQWGSFHGLKIPKDTLEVDDSEPVVAVTIARMKFLQIPRFIRWGRPVEKLVRDDPASVLSMATIKLPRTVSTFSIWKTQKDMTDMVRGHSDMPKPKRHIEAMKERNRKDFHIEFTTLRFKAISETGKWEGKKNYISGLKLIK